MDDDDMDIIQSRPPVDSKVAAAAQFVVESRGEDDITDENIDALLEDLDKDDDFDFGSLREQRMEELKHEISKMKTMKESSHGRYTDLTDEKEVLTISASEDRCIIHFAHRDFRRCQIMDSHLEKIAPKYFSTRFIRVYVENVPWLVTKLEIKVLPCVITFLQGKITHRFVGFEEMGNDDSFETSMFEMQLKLTGVLEEPKSVRQLDPITPYSKLRQGGSKHDDDDDFEYDI